jgi:hypothetical protein
MKEKNRGRKEKKEDKKRIRKERRGEDGKIERKIKIL